MVVRVKYGDLMETRIADLTDLVDLQRLVSGFRAHLERSHPDDETLQENLKYLLVSGEAEFLIAIDDTGTSVGYAQQRYRYSLWLSGQEATLEDLFVSPEGRGQGVGDSLVQFAIARAKKMGCRAIKLDTNEGNQIAVHLYRRLGFSSGSSRFPESRQLSFEKILVTEPHDTGRATGVE